MTVDELIERLRREQEEGRGRWVVMVYEEGGRVLAKDLKAGRDNLGKYLEVVPYVVK